MCKEGSTRTNSWNQRGTKVRRDRSLHRIDIGAVAGKMALESRSAPAASEKRVQHYASSDRLLINVLTSVA